MTICHINQVGDNMPTQTFFHLSKEKQTTLLKAAMKEFTHQSFANASINQIIKEASIPRGSFYMYFQDKEDLYFYLLEQSRDRFQKQLLILIEEEHGDLFCTFERFFESIIDYCSKKNHRLFFKQVFANINSQAEKRLFPTKTNVFDPRSFYKHFLEQIDVSKLNIQQEDDLEEIVGLLFGMTLHTLILSFTSDKKKEEIMNSYHRKLILLKYGMEKYRKE